MAIGIVAVAHLLLLWALIEFDVIPVAKARPEPLVVTLIPDPIAPPPAPPEEKIVPLEPVEPVIVASKAVVPTPAPPPPVAVTINPPPPQATVVAVSTPTPPAPITPPDASAANLGNPAPRYPIEARRKKQQGTVRLRVVITAEGRVKEISIAKSSGFESLDEAALETVRKWRFRPGMQAGRAVEAVGFVPIPFVLKA